MIKGQDLRDGMQGLVFRSFNTRDLSSELKNFILNLTERHMRAIYNEAASLAHTRAVPPGSKGPRIGAWRRWSTKAKRRELFALASMFVIAFWQRNPAALGDPAAQQSVTESSIVEIVNMYSFEKEVRSRTRSSTTQNVPTQHVLSQVSCSECNSELLVPVAFACYRIVNEWVPRGTQSGRVVCEKHSLLYVYELHCLDTWRGCGIGTQLVHFVEGIASQLNVAGVALTCLKNNPESLIWYKRRGYERAPHCPDTDGGSVYQILWKELQERNALPGSMTTTRARTAPFDRCCQS